MIFRRVALLALLLCLCLSMVAFLSVQLGLGDSHSRELIFLRSTSTERGEWHVRLDVDRRLEIPLWMQRNPLVWSPDGESLFYQMYIGQMEIMMETGDGDIINLTSSPGHDVQPNSSPDGTMIAFISDRTGAPELFIMDANGENVRQVTDDSSVVSYSLWSPDSQRIAYFVASSGSGRLYVVALETLTTAEPQLIATSLAGCTNFQWSPDSRYLLCEMRASEDIFRMDIETGDTLNLTNHPANDAQAVWSPDGTMIAFMSDRAANAEIFLMDADGRNLRNLTNSPQTEGYPRWSPDGSRILYSGGTATQPHLYVLDVASGEQTLLTERLYSDYSGAVIFNNLGNGGLWSPDGEKVLLRVAVGRGRQFFIVNADGTDLHPVTFANPLFADSNPRWRP